MKPTVAISKKLARVHHKKHGDMEYRNGKPRYCLLAACAVHYPVCGPKREKK